MKDKLLYIIIHYGDKHQLKKLKEEQKELRDALKLYQKCKKERPYKGVPTKVKDAVITEVADNFVLLGQFITKYGITKEELEKEINFKVNRTINEMGKERKGR